MRAKELLDANKLSAAIYELTQEVKQHPADTRLRTFLFEVLCFAGEYERAERQLDVIGHQDEGAGVGVEVYRQNIRAEIARRRLFRDGLRPSFLLDPPSYIDDHLNALNRLREGHTAEARKLLERSQTTRPPIRGQLAGRAFSSFRDSDDVLVPILEVIVKGSYVWLPFEQIRKVTIVPPKHLRDLLWIKATIEAGDGPAGDGFLPVLYAGSEEDENDQVRLGRMTEWKAVGEGLARGAGQRTFLVDDEEKAILEMREIEFEVGPKSDSHGGG